METFRQLMHRSWKLSLSGLVTLTSLNLATFSVVPQVVAAPEPAVQASVGQRQPQLLAQRSRRVIFRLTDRGVPVSRVGGAARGGCSSNTPHMQLTALTPITSTGKSALVETVSSHPTFFVYLPETSAQKAEFVVQDMKSQKDLYHETLMLKRTGGIVQVSLPTETTTALEPNRQYNWSFTLLCDPEDASANLFVEGVVQRVEATSAFAQEIKDKQLADQAPLYAAQGYWFESLQTLAQMRQSNPQDKAASEDWADLLSSVKLDAIAQQPILSNWAEKTQAQ
jgi:hypothetical protein